MRRRMNRKRAVASVLVGAREAGAPAQAVAVKRALTNQIEQAMNKARITKAELARRMDTSRSQVDRLLDPDTESVTLDTLARAAQAVGRRVRVELV